MPKTFGEMLKKARENAGLNTIEFAKLLDLSQSTCSKYENDYMKKVDIELIRRICEVLEIEPNDLFCIKSNKTVYPKLIRKSLEDEVKPQMLERLMYCYETTKKEGNDELIEYMDNVWIMNSDSSIRVDYSISGCILSKNEDAGFVLFLCIVYHFVSDMLKVVENNFTKELGCWYMFYGYIVEIIAKL